MRVVVYLAWISAVIAFVAGQEEEQEAPVLVLKPLGESHVRALGQPIMFTCEVLNAVDDGQYNIQWLSGSNSEITDTTGSRMYVEDDGPALKKLYITQIEGADAGTYTCRATINNNQQEQKAKIVIYKAITFDNAPSPQNPKIYTDALVSCVVSGEPKPIVSWRFGGKRVSFASGSRHSLSAEGMVIRNITQQDNGEYICRAEVNTDGRYNEQKITVEVFIPPSVTKSPGRVEVIEGDQADFTCEASGLPKPKYEFIKAGETNPLQTSDRIIVDSNMGTVKFTQTVKSDEGPYTCKAINAVGEDQVEGHIHVSVRPKIFELENVTQTEGAMATLVCRSRGDPVPAMTFQKVGQAAEFASGENDDGRIQITETDGVLQMVINNLISTDTGNYVCKSESDIGSDEMTGSLTVNYRPKFMESLSSQEYSWSGRTSNISCSANGSPSPVLTWLNKDRILKDTEAFTIFNVGNTSYLQVTVREADQSWIYDTYVCRAENELGSSDFNIELKRASAPSNPSLVNATNISPISSDLVIELPEEDGGMPVIGYVVEYEKQVYEFAEIGQPLTLKNLQPNTTYDVSVRAKNEVGAGNPYELTFTTQPTRKPYALAIISETQGTSAYDYLLKWETPNSGGSPITEYELKYRTVKLITVNNTQSAKPITDWTVVMLPENKRQPISEHLITKLETQISYEIQIRAQNRKGWSDKHRRFFFTTSSAAAAAAHDRSSAPSIVSRRLGSFISVVSLWTLVMTCCMLNAI